MRALILAAALFAALPRSSFADDAVRPLRFGVGLAVTTPALSRGVLPVLKSMEDISGGRLKFEIYGGGAVVTLAGTARGVRDGVVDGGFVGLSYVSSYLPHTSMVSQMAAFASDSYAASGALHEFILTQCPECLEELSRENLVPLLGGSGAPSVIFCRPETTTLDDLHGRAAGVVNATMARWAKSLGMSAEILSPADFAPAVERGRIDCVIAPMSWLRAFGLVGAVHSVIEPARGVIVGALPVTLNREAWSRFSPEERRRVVDLMPGAAFDFAERGFLLPDAAVRKGAAEGPGRLAFLNETASVGARWTAWREHERAALIALAERRGLDDAKGFVDRMITVFDTWDRLTPSEGWTRDMFAITLKARAFDPASVPVFGLAAVSVPP
jgi:TRAP-type C4-dicarboxylate transport system substrate-binding protein